MYRLHSTQQGGERSRLSGPVRRLWDLGWESGGVDGVIVGAEGGVLLAGAHSMLRGCAVLPCGCPHITCETEGGDIEEASQVKLAAMTEIPIALHT